ncbi:transposase [Nonlabens xiamenensis]|nr:transposase [Nonlabens xiamenensis]
MDKYNEVYGVDISKDSFDVYSERFGHECFTNDEKGYYEYSRYR